MLVVDSIVEYLRRFVMITIGDLLKLNEFNNFKLITSSKTTSRSVSGVGLFEWESPTIINDTFSPGEFIFTTLSKANEDIDDVFPELKALILKDVSAIALKNVRFTSFPNEIISFANTHNVALFIFSNTYIDDLVYVVKNTVVLDSLHVSHSELFAKILSSSSDDVPFYAKELNPFFCDNLVCLCMIPLHKAENDLQERTLEYYFDNTLLKHDYSRCTFVQYESAYFFIFTDPDIKSISSLNPEDLIPTPAVFLDDYTTGVSCVKTNLSELKSAIHESFIACVSSAIDNEKSKNFNDIGSDILIIPQVNNELLRSYYSSFLEILEGYDCCHSSNLMGTLLCFIKCDGDINLTSTILFQHSNTIRYRINKIKTILNLNDSPDAYIQLYVFVRIHAAINYLNCIQMNLL